MPITADLTVRETAALSRVPGTTVENALEAGVLRAVTAPARFRGGATRYLPIRAVAYFHSLKAANLIDLPLRHKRAIWTHLVRIEPLRLEAVEFTRGTTLDLERLAADALRDAERYRETRDRCIASDADILGGTPVIAGTRLTVLCDPRSAAGRRYRGRPRGRLSGGSARCVRGRRTLRPGPPASRTPVRQALAQRRLTAGRTGNMRLFLDECLSPRIGQALNAEGAHVAVYPRDFGGLGAPDREALARCVELDFVLVTENARDFRALVATEDVHPGIGFLAERGDPMDVMVNHVLEVSEKPKMTLYPLSARER